MPRSGVTGLRSAWPQALLNLYEMPDLVDHPARRRSVLELHRVADAAKTEPANHGGLVVLEPDRALDERHLHRTALGVRSVIRHGYAPARSNSASSLPRIRAIATGSFSECSPSNVARTTLCGLAEPSDFVRMFVTPADSTTARTAPPAMMPVPSGAGFSSTLPAPKRPVTA